jgi:ATP-dependent Lon protease
MGRTVIVRSLIKESMENAEKFTNPLPLLPLRRGLVLPGATTTVPVGRPRSRAMAEQARSGDLVVIGVQRDAAVEEPGEGDIHAIATLARVKDTVQRGHRGVLLVVEGLRRVRVDGLPELHPYWKAEVSEVEELRDDTEEAQVRADALREHLTELAGDEKQIQQALARTPTASLTADRVASWLEAEDDDKLAVLLELDVEARLRRVNDLLVQVRGRAELRQKIDSELRREMSKTQKEALLRQQLKAIQKELGEDEEGDDADKLRAKLDEKDLPDEVRQAADRELRRLKTMGPQQAESNIIRSYLEWILALPWNERADVSNDIDAVSRVLDEDHFGLDDVKKRILEHMAVLKLTGRRQGTILALAGPPGVGKTSLAQSIATATGRPLARVSLGGVRDEAEVRGHRRTYVGALPGRILHALKKAQVKNPVVVLDEIDKLGKGWSGDPEAALLEVLDPEQNAHFVDHYLELPFDLSEVMFVATANELASLSPPLRDRLEIIEVSGYTTDEKQEIARRHLLPNELEKHGLPESGLELSDEVLATVIRDYTREAGVRQLSRELAKICRAVALELARSDDTAREMPARIRDADLRRYLGRPRFQAELAEHQTGPGVAAGLAWTPSGGDILYVETTRMPGRGKVEITGQLGDVMQESARAALAYLRSHAGELDIDPAFLETSDVHIHVPAGAVPKDGPSAGVTIFTALASLLTGRSARHDTAMTGEATLRGRVLPVGGIKAKVLAAHRAGFSRVVLPKRNEHDLEDVPESVRDELEVILAEDMAQVIEATLEPERASQPGTPRDAERAPAAA